MGFATRAITPGTTTSSARPAAARTTAPANSVTGTATSTAPTSDQIQLMQQVMGDLSTELAKIRGAISIVKPDAQAQAKSLIAKFSQTQAGARAVGNAAADGVWGTNTTNALNAISQFIALLNDNLNKPVIIAQKTANAQEDARKNIESIVQLMQIAGLSAPASLGTAHRDYDLIPTTLTAENSAIPAGDPWLASRMAPLSAPANGIRITQAHLNSLSSFYSLVSRMAVPTVNRSLFNRTSAIESVASQIVKSSFFTPDELLKIADTASAPTTIEHDRAAPTVRGQAYSSGHATNRDAPSASSDVQQPGSPIRNSAMTVRQMDAAITWFYQRANRMPEIISWYIENPEQNKVSGGGNRAIFTNADLDTAEKYEKAVLNLAQKWEEVSARILDSAAENGDADPSSVVIDPYSLSSGGFGRRRPGSYDEDQRSPNRGKGRGSRDGGYETSDTERVDLARDIVYSSTINLRDIRWRNSSDNRLIMSLKSPVISYRVFNQSDVATLIPMIVRNDVNDKMAAMATICSSITEMLADMQSRGMEEIQEQYGPEAAMNWMNSQDYYKQAWTRVLNEKAEAAMRNSRGSAANRGTFQSRPSRSR